MNLKCSREQKNSVCVAEMCSDDTKPNKHKDKVNSYNDRCSFISSAKSSCSVCMVKTVSFQSLLHQVCSWAVALNHSGLHSLASVNFFFYSHLEWFINFLWAIVWMSWLMAFSISLDLEWMWKKKMYLSFSYPMMIRNELDIL